MKNIKEKAKEHGLEYPGIRCSNDDIYKDCDKPSMDFEAGANYVLDNLSKTIVVSEDGYLRDNLRKMIKLLKGE